MESLKDKHNELLAQLREQAKTHDNLHKHFKTVQSQIEHSQMTLVGIQAQLRLLYDLDPSLKETKD